MTTIVDALNRAGRQCSVTQPDSWISATSLAHVELRDDFLAGTVEEIADRVDLPSPVGKQQTITGTDAENYALNSDFKRLTHDPMSIYESTTTRRAGVPVITDANWTHLKNIGSAGAYRYYRLKGYDGNFTIDFFANPSSAVSITVSYVSNLWMATSAGVAGTAFTDATDVLLMPRLVVEKGIVWRFRQRKGLQYNDVLAEYEALLERLTNDARSRKIIAFGESGQDYKPMRVPVPDFIPAS